MADDDGFEIVGEITRIEIIAIGRSIRDIKRLRRQYGAGRWRKLKGIARVRLLDLSEWSVELHWYEAHGIGRRDMRIKRFLE